MVPPTACCAPPHGAALTASALSHTPRVFDKIKSRNAHMKRHRLQDHVEPVVRVKWPAKPFQLKEEEEEEEELGAAIGPLQW